MNIIFYIYQNFEIKNVKIYYLWKESINMEASELHEFLAVWSENAKLCRTFLFSYKRDETHSLRKTFLYPNLIKTLHLYCTRMRK